MYHTAAPLYSPSLISYLHLELKLLRHNFLMDFRFVRSPGKVVPH